MSIDKNKGRYTVPSNEDFEPDSNNEVIKNYLGIKSKKDIEAIEEQELNRTALELLSVFDKNHQFTVEDIRDIHQLWLGNIYPWAGKYRTVTMSKNGFPFAFPQRIETSMLEFETKYLMKYTPCHYSKPNELAKAVGIVHIELILIHPFREGNGRTARLLADLMVMQAGRPPLDYTLIDQTKNMQGFERYIAAIHAGHDTNYVPITNVFKTLFKETTI